MKTTTLIVSTLLSVVLLVFSCQHVDPLTPPADPKKDNNSFSVTQTEAIQAADEFFRLRDVQSYKSARQGTDDSTYTRRQRKVKSTKIRKDDGGDLMYIINYDDDRGFALVSADKRFTPIIASSVIGGFDDNALPGVKDWLEITERLVKATRKELKEQRPQEKALWNKYLKNEQLGKGARTSYSDCPTCRDYYETRSTGQMTNSIAQYSQGNSYSYYTPGDGGCNCGRKPAGCGAVAMAIVMRYYRHPDMMMSFNGESMLLNDAGYDAMPRLRYEAGYDCGRPNDNVRRLSMLLRLSGSAAGSGYGVFGNCNTWTIPGDINNALSNMGYSNGGYWSDLTNQHYEVVFSELNQYKPVIFTGTTCDTCLGDAHIWVADGLTNVWYDYQVSTYDENGSVCYCTTGNQKYISMNWGHGGQNNGDYLAFENFNYLKSYNGYNKYIRALVNIRP